MTGGTNKVVRQLKDAAEDINKKLTDRFGL
jgi:hypothetical protein